MANARSSERRVRVGVVGSGSIAQIMHLPYLRELGDLFTIAALCDVSPATLEVVGERFGVPGHARFADYRELATSDLIDAVLICPTGSHVPPAIAALEYGKHVLIEKPLCYRLDEADALVDAARTARRRSGAVTLLAYMKRFDPGYQYGQRLVRPLAERGQVRFVDARHIHPSNDLYMSHQPVFRGHDVPPEIGERAEREHDAAIAASLGDDPPAAVRRVFGGMMGSSIHDVYCLNGLLGRPEEIVASETWDGGRCWTAIFRYPNGVRVNYAWIDTRQIREFKQDYACFGADGRVTISFPSPFLKSAPTVVSVQGMEPPPDNPAPLGRDAIEPGWPDPGPAHWERRVTASHEEAFKREWIHFYACITQGVEPLVSPEEARDDTAFIVDWARATALSS
ncbi:MAG TPA: Gfo/Idh/MocA family oxidoreductase [Chloroflexota bacterium]|nr:Gfo/Idh/MocA family oxidoreductase [Chloroflexota bacterium]